MGLPKRAQLQCTMDTKCTERIRREYNGRHSNHRRNSQETGQANEELDSIVLDMSCAVHPNALDALGQTPI